MSLAEVSYKDLSENKYNPRKHFDDVEMVELTESIKRVGLLEPLVVRKISGKTYEVVCGIRRYKALGHINNGKKIPVNIVDINDHEAMVLSFTENFQRVGFSPVEEARFFYNALEIKDISELRNYNRSSPTVKTLSEDLPASTDTISKRLFLLTLPEKVQEMLESHALSLQVGEEVSRLRQIEDEKIREKKMLQYAQDYSGDRPNLEKLNDDITKELSFEKDRQSHDKDKLKEYEKQEKQRKKELEDTLNKTIDWYNKQFNEKIKPDLENIEDIMKKLTDRSAELITDKEFKRLVKEQITIEDKIKHLETNLDIIRREQLSACPFCGGFVNISKVKTTVKSLDDKVDSLKEQQANISVTKQDIEQYREKLHRTHIAWTDVCEQIEKLKPGAEE
jgi:ParB family chromosome partitioning protein